MQDVAPFAGVRLARGSLMGGTLTRPGIVFWPCVVGGWWWASVHCWVLREHTLGWVCLLVAGSCSRPHQLVVSCVSPSGGGVGVVGVGGGVCGGFPCVV